MEALVGNALVTRLGIAATILVGAGLSAPLLLFSRRFGARKFRWIWALALIAAAIVHVGFAAVQGDGRSVLLESLGLVLFTAVAVLGIAQRPELLVLGWAGHVGWDLLVPAAGSGYVPSWYPPLCVGFDLFVAGFLLAVLAGAAKGAPRDAAAPPQLAIERPTSGDQVDSAVANRRTISSADSTASTPATDLPACQ